MRFERIESDRYYFVGNAAVSSIAPEMNDSVERHAFSVVCELQFFIMPNVGHDDCLDVIRKEFAHHLSANVIAGAFVFHDLPKTRSDFTSIPWRTYWSTITHRVEDYYEGTARGLWQCKNCTHRELKRYEGTTKKISVQYTVSVSGYLK